MLATETKSANANANAIANANVVNGIDLSKLHKLVEDIKRDPANAMTRWGVTTRWAGGTVSETQVSACEVSGRTIPKKFKIRIDEPLELAGSNTAPNPQECLLAAFNACMTVGYVALAAMHGIELESCQIESSGEIDLRGFLALDQSVKPGYDEIHYTVHIQGQWHARTVRADPPGRDGDQPQSV